MMETMLSKLVKGLDSQENYLKEIKVDILLQTQKEKLHATVITQLEQQFGKMPTPLNQRQSGTLSSNIVQNPKNDGHRLFITNQNGNASIDPPMPMVDEARNDSVELNEIPDSELEKSKGVDNDVEKDNGKGNIDKLVVQTIP